MDFKAVLASLLKRFNDHKIRYGLMGGFAFGLWGVGRSTVDLDFLIDRNDMEKIDAVMVGLGYECRFRSANVSQYVSSLKVLGEIDYLHAFREISLEMLERAVLKDIYGGELKIRVLMPEDLIGLKLQAIKNNPARKEADMTDILALADAQRDAIDWPRVKEYAKVLDAESLIKELEGA